MRRTRGGAATALALATIGASLALATAPAGADGFITPWSTEVAVGATFSVTANGCPRSEEEGDTSYRYQQAELILITGSGAGERVAAFGRAVDDQRYRFLVPGWVDPDEPAVVAGRCVRTTYTYGPGVDEETTETLFTFADAAIDITANPSAPPGPTFSLSTPTAAGGQVVTVTGSGCSPGGYVQAVVAVGGDLSGRTLQEFTAYGGGMTGPDGSFEFELALNRYGFGPGGEDGAGPLDPGPHVVLAACDASQAETLFAEPQPLTVDGQFPSDQVDVVADGGDVTVSGSGCLPGETVSVAFTGYAYENDPFTVFEERARARAQRQVLPTDRLAPTPDGEVDEVATTVAEADGSWTLTTPAPATSYELTVIATCGDPTTTGFRYVERYVYATGYADLYVQRVSPTSSPTGGPVTVHVAGECEGALTVDLVTRDGTTIASSSPGALGTYHLGAVDVTAPDRAGTYGLRPRCDDEPAFPERYEVFEPTQLAPEGPLPTEPTDGWPNDGPRETYEGRIGPITLPPMSPDEMGEEAARALGPSELFIDVPRPDGDFAITEMTFDLVDAGGDPVGQDRAHLHHFVIADRSSENPACPGGTFGLPGQIIAASGAERTVLELGDPYGLVVEDDDAWSGVYSLMNKSMEAQEVYLAYDITYRRDVENVRPVTTYFGSATGCSSFTWTIDGSGTPDVQSAHIPIANDGRLVGAGGHIHNGGLHTDLVDDRGRRLCRSELQTGEPSMHGGHDTPTDPDYPPEFYPDDPEILGITTCALAEQVTAGERLRFDAVYANDQARSGVMGIYTFHVWEGGGPEAAEPPGAPGIPGRPSYTG